VKTKTLILLIIILTSSVSAQVLDFPPATILGSGQSIDQDARNRLRHASNLEMMGQYKEALNLYLELYNNYPDYMPFYDGVIRSFVAAGEFERGFAWTDSLQQLLMQKLEPDVLTASERENLGNLIVDSGRFLGRLERRDEALKRWELLYKLPHLTSSPYYRLFSAMIDIRYPEGLEEMVARARKVTHEPTLLAASLANYLVQRGEIEAAIKEWLNLLELQPRQSEFIKRSILGLPDDEMTQKQVEAALKKFKNREGMRLQVTEILGEFYFRNRNWEKAYEQVREADQMQDGSGVALIGFAENLLSENENKLAADVLADLEKWHPQAAQSTRALLVNARNLEALAQYEEADSVYSILTSVPLLRSPHGQIALIHQAKMQLGLGKPVEARNLLENALKTVPRMQDPGQVILLIGDTYLAQRNLKMAKETYQEATEGRYGRQADFVASALINVGLIDYYEGEFDKAMERLKEASTKSPNSLLTNNALDLLEMIRTNRSDSLTLEMFAQADLEERAGVDSIAKSMYRNVSLTASSPDLIERAILKNAELELSSGRIDSAIAQLSGFVERFPKSVRATETLMQIGDLYRDKLGDANKATEYYEKILIDYPDALEANQARQKLREMEHSQT